MDFYSPKKIKDTLLANSICLSKSLGQNFLISKDIVRKLIDSSGINTNDTVLEVGPGLGAITSELVEKAKRVIAIEKDRKLYEILKNSLASDNLEIINKDILDFDENNLDNYILLSNLPYSISTVIIRKFLESKNPPKKIVCLVQKEVAQRICSLPPDMSVLSVAIQFYSRPKILFHISKNNFSPKPKTDSSVIEIIPEKKFDIDENFFFRIVKAGFFSPRKKALNNISSKLSFDKEKLKAVFEKAGVDLGRRAETFTIKEWADISSLLI